MSAETAVCQACGWEGASSGTRDDICPSCGQETLCHYTPASEEADRAEENPMARILDWRTIEAAATDLYERTTLSMPRSRQIAEMALSAALPAALADYRARLVEAEAKILAMRPTAGGEDEATTARRLTSKAEGVRLALSYLDEMLRA